jgi:hypothetical protein
MGEIVFPKCALNEFGIASCIATLSAYCVYPTDAARRDEMVKLFNIRLHHRFNGFDFRPYHDELDNPERRDEFWKGLQEFASNSGTEIPDTITSTATPRQYAEVFVKALGDIASQSLELPEDIVGFLVNAKNTKHSLVNSDEYHRAIRGMQTAVCIVLKLIKLKNNQSVLHKDASLSSAIALLTLEESGCPQKNETDIKKSWAIYKKSVHLMLGLIFAESLIRNTPIVKNLNKGKYMSDLFSIYSLSLILLVAAVFQKFLLSFKPPRNSAVSHLVKAKHLWLVPPKISPLAFYPMLAHLSEPLSEVELAKLGEKRRIPKS